MYVHVVYIAVSAACKMQSQCGVRARGPQCGVMARGPYTLRVKITCPKSRVLLSSFAASITRIYCARARTTVEDHGCTGQGKHATRTTTQRFSRPMPLLLLYRAPSFGCSSFFVHRGLCKNRSIDVRGRTQCYT